MRYIVGIDLGTTNCAVAYVDTLSSHMPIQPWRITQLVAEGYSDAQPTLPSFCYLASQGEWPTGALTLPWAANEQDFFVGRFAQTQGAKVPNRLVSSAKSWLCHNAANRREKILPFEFSDKASRISPVEASARYLSHIRQAWNDSYARGNSELELEEQEVVLTVPASFDEVARTLTAEAARQAGFKHLTLLEEPQAAFYSWLAQHEATWHRLLPLGSTVLVCDVGGGTTDFSLIEVAGTVEQPTLQRMAVGDHLLLGGDNMDRTVAHFIEPQLFSEEPSLLQWMQLIHQARLAKEALLNGEQEQFQIILHGTGSSVVKGSQNANLQKSELQKLLIDGFFASYSWEEASNWSKAVGMRTMGLPYEDEPSITRHLARFLKQSCTVGHMPKGPDFVLFNGGTMKSTLFQQAILQALSRWFPAKSIQVLDAYNLDLAVGRGAAYYGKVRRGMGVKIGGGMPRGYYLGLNLINPDTQKAELRALTLLPRGSEEGASYEPEHTFHLQPNTPVSFQLYTSHVRLNDHAGDIIEVSPEELQLLPPIHTALRFGSRQRQSESSQTSIPVHVHAHLNAIGTLELWLKSLTTEHTWSLQFQLRNAAGQENSLAVLEKRATDELLDNSLQENANLYLKDVFTASSGAKLKSLMDGLENILERPRREWSPSVLRALWEPLLQLSATRNLSWQHEERWWNLAGFLLRPGYGYPLDDFRIKEFWRLLLAELKMTSAKSIEIQIQQWICYRRIAGGLNKGQQMQIAQILLPQIFDKKGKIVIKGKGEAYRYSEKMRALASFELLEVATKVKIGNALVERILQSDGMPVDFWALSRIGARHLLYGSTANVVPAAMCANWLQKILSQKESIGTAEIFPLLISLARKTDQREINLPRQTIEQILTHFENSDKAEELQKALNEESALSRQEQEFLFGEQLPVGLTLHLT